MGYTCSAKAGFPDLPPSPPYYGVQGEKRERGAKVLHEQVLSSVGSCFLSMEEC